MTSFTALDGVTSFLRLKDVTITCKRMRRSLSIGGSSSVQWRIVGGSWRLRMCFRRLLCVRIEIDQLQCVNCWVIIHCLSVSCTKINHSRCTLVIWSSLQLTSKQWIITQQFTVGADLFLKPASNGHSKYTQQRSLRQMGAKWRSRVLQNTFDLHYVIIGLKKKKFFLVASYDRFYCIQLSLMGIQFEK